MKQSLGRRPRARLLVPAATIAALFLVPAVASADITATRITSPSAGAILEGAAEFPPPETPGSTTTTVTGTATGAATGDTVDIVCDATFYGLSQVVELTGGPVTVTDGTFSTSDAVVPELPCTLRAIPSDEGVTSDDALTTAQQAAYTGPLVYAGQYQAFGLEPGATRPNLVLNATRGQARGVAKYLSAGLGSPFEGQLGSLGGIAASFTSDGGNLRAMFNGSGMLGSFAKLAPTTASGRAATRAVPPVDLADAGLVVDGRPASPFFASDTGEYSQIVSHRVDPVTGDLTIVETAPIVFADTSPGGTFQLPSAGLRLRRTLVQDHDGRQITYRDTFESVDEAPHGVEVRYSEGVALPEVVGPHGFVQTVPPAYRVPWTSGETFSTPAAGTAIAPAPAGPATIYAHAPQFAVPAATRASTRAAASTGGPEGAFTFDAAPSDGRFLSPSSFVIRFVREVPAGGSTAIRHVYSQDATQEGLEELIDDALGRVRPTTPPPADPLPGTAPLPTKPAPVTPAALIDPTERLSLAARGLLLKPRYARYVRDGRRTNVVLSRAPAGRYTVAIRRYVKNGRTLASGAVTKTSTSTVRIPVKLSRSGARYFEDKRRRGQTEVKVRVQVTYTAPGQKTKRIKKIRVVRFR